MKGDCQFQYTCSICQAQDRHSILAAKHSKGFYKSTKQAERIEKSGLIGKKDMRNLKNPLGGITNKIAIYMELENN